MAEIFVSYAREDKEFVQLLYRALQQRKRDTWVDWEGIRPTAEWRQEIFRAIEAADSIVLIVSPHSAASKVCMEELAHASGNNKRIIPILHKDVDPLALPEFVQKRQWILFRESDDFASAIVSLLSALDTDLEWVKAHTRLLTRAIEWDEHKHDYSFALHGSELRSAETLITSNQGREPRLLPLQIDYILSSRRDANKRFSFAIGAASLALVAILVFGLSFWEKRKESALNLAANFREMGISELGNNNPLAAEVLFARALSVNNNLGARERLIEARAKSPLLLWIAPHHPETTVLAVSGDGVLFATATPLQVSIWNVLQRKEVRTFRTILNSPDKIYAAFGPKHRLLAIGAANRIEIWDLQSMSEQPVNVITHRHNVSSLTFSFDGASLLVGDETGLISIRDAKDQTEGPIREYSGHSDRITGLAVGSDGHALISASWDETARIWDLQGKTNRGTFTGHDDAVLCVAISPDSKLVASAGWDDTIWIWDRVSGKPVRALNGHKGSILSLAFSPDGRWLVSGSEDRTARLWDVEKGVHLLTLPGHSSDVSAVGFIDMEGRYQLVTGDTTGIVRLWDISKIGQRDELETLRGHEGAVTMVAFSPTEPLVASSSVDKSIDIWNLTTRRLVTRLTDQPNNISAVAFSPDGKQLASADKTAGVTVWNIEAGSFKRFDDQDTEDKVRHIAFSPNGLLLVGGSDNGKVIVWKTEDGTRLKAFFAHTAKIQGLEFSPDGSLLASASEDSTVKLWQVTDWRLRRTLIGHRSGVYEIAFSPDGRLLLTASDDKTARLWRVESGKEIIKPIQHDSPVWAVDISSDGKEIATGSEDSTVQLWDLSVSGDGAEVHNHTTLRLSDGPVWWLQFHEYATGIDLGIGGQDRTVRIFNMSRFKTLFSNPEALEKEAGAQGGLMIGETSGELHIESVPDDQFSARQPDPGSQAVVEIRP